MTFIINEPTVSSRDFMLYIHTYIYMPHIVSYIADLIFDLVCVGACIYIYIYVCPCKWKYERHTNTNTDTTSCLKEIQHSRFSFDRFTGLPFLPRVVLGLRLLNVPLMNSPVQGFRHRNSGGERDEIVDLESSRNGPSCSSTPPPKARSLRSDQSVRVSCVRIC